MNIKVELNNYLKYKEDIANLQGELLEIQEDIGLSGGNSDSTGIRAKGFKKATMEAQAIANVTKEQRIKRKIEKLQRKMKCIEGLVESLKGDSKEIMNLFFIIGKSNRYVANKFNVTIEAIKKRKSRIIRNMQKKYDKSKNVPEMSTPLSTMQEKKSSL